ncbi:MAG: 4-(cytidine 5'-diphospho)-2-C-methyl-D-erythritol kinase [Hyphomicrobiaceae bacterium]
MAVVERAYAKVNLNLHILGRRSDGYHELDSLVVFARDIFDTIELHPANRIEVHVAGAFATEIAGENLIATAARSLHDADPALQIGEFYINKRIPVAAGLGGGSADAAAALRALARLNKLAGVETRLADLATGLGADVPVCLGGGGCEAAFMRGIGERVERPAAGRLLPAAGVHAVVINPRIPVSTAEIFRRLGAAQLVNPPRDAAHPQGFDGFEELIAYLSATSNDLQGPACEMVPAIGDALAVLEGVDGCCLSRMSGSGATCFGIFETVAAAERGRDLLRRAHPDWWVESSKLT